VSGTAWVVIWAENTTGSSNVFTLSADGRQVGTQTTSSRGPVTLPWDTRSVANGTHTLTATVRDASGNTGTTSITIIVNN
jgi:Bacterial Ig-like domain